MRRSIIITQIFLFFIFHIAFAQLGKNGSLIVTSTVFVNEYTSLTSNTNAGSTSIKVGSSSLNAHSRFTANLASGDLIMIIQMQGASLNGAIDRAYGNVGLPNDSSWGAITNYNNCGNYEFAEVNSVPNGTTINLDCPLQFNYIDSGKVQIVRVPRYTTLTINNGGTVTCDAWDSATGGIIVMEVENNSVINTGGSILATGLGFRGGQYNGEDSTGWGANWFSSTFQSLGKEKGEGIGGYEWSYKKYGGKESMGAPGNGGGGGTAQNAGGGGGANGGVVANYINGYGNPDVSTPDNITAWKLEDSWLASFTSSGGGRGGYTFSANNANPLTNGPSAAAWAGDNRRNAGGRGGRPLDYSTGKIFMGGGGGCGDQNNDNGGAGGNGGGIVYLTSYGTVSGGGQIISNGSNGLNAHGTAAFGHAAGIDAAGGAGGGGTIIVNSSGNISGISLSANGGAGGNQVITWDLSSDPEAEGPGGGGGGGYIATSNPGLTETSSGGANGMTNAIPMTNFPPNGATKGGVGTTNATTTNFHLSAQNDTICSGQSATITASISGNPPVGTTIEWYTTDTGGVAVASGSNYITPILNGTKTYYVGSCPGTYRMAITVVVTGNTINISPGDSICLGSSDSLHALITGATAYTWSPSVGLNSTNIPNPIATPTVTTIYSVSVSTKCGIIKDSVKVMVSSLKNIQISAIDSQVCAGNSTILMAGGGTQYLWSNGATISSISVTPSSTTTYNALIRNGGCIKDTSIRIKVNPLPIVTISASNDSICAGSSTSISATGGISYAWNNSATSSSINVSPDSTSTYSVLVNNGTCTKDTIIAIAVKQLPLITITPAQRICKGENVTVSASGGTKYQWSTGSTNDSIKVSPAKPTGYTVTVSNGCIDSASTYISIDNPTMNACCDSVILSGNSTHINSATAGIIHYKWLPETGLNCDTCPDVKATPTLTTTYTVTGTDSLGCIIERYILVTVESPCKELKVPNVFTPNGDGHNDVFEITAENIEIYSITIYDRWGKEMYKSSNPTQYWNGNTESGNKASDGMYYYVINATCQGTDYRKDGLVQLIR